MKRLLILVGLLVWFTSSDAQKFGFAADAMDPAVKRDQIESMSDAKAKDVLLKVYKKYETFETLKFSLEVTAKVGEDEQRTSGKVLMKGKKYRIETKDQLIVSDGKTNWLLLVPQNQLQISNYIPSFQTNFSYPAAFLQKQQFDYIIKDKGESTVDGRVVSKIEMIPFDFSAQYQKITVLVDKNTLKINELTIQERQGASFTIEVKNLSSDITLADKNFSFNASRIPTSNITDLR